MAKITDEFCKVVGKGTVGASGASVQLAYKVPGSNTDLRLLVVRCNESNLPADTGAWATMLIDGSNAAVPGDLTNGAVLKAETQGGVHVVVLVQIFSRLNDVRPGDLADLHFQLVECNFGQHA